MFLSSAFILGLLGSFHCVGMCGPVILSFPFTSHEKGIIIFQSLIYQLGRVTTYGMFGLLLGFFGWGINLGGYQSVISIILGILLILSAVFSFSLESNVMRNSYIQNAFQKLKKAIANQLSISSTSSAYKTGFLNGFLPCGLVYVALAGALASKSALSGSLYMIIFGLGTLPLMMATMYYGQSLKKYLSKYQKVIPIAMIVFGLYLVIRGIYMDMPTSIDQI